MSNTEGLPNYMTKFSGLTEEQLSASVRADIAKIKEKLGDRLTSGRTIEEPAP